MRSALAAWASPMPSDALVDDLLTTLNKCKVSEREQSMS
jgi:hypothetical protein